MAGTGVAYRARARIAGRPERFRGLVLAAAGVLLFCWPLVDGEDAIVSLAAVVAALAIGVVGLDLAIGRAGMVHLGYGLFFGAGEYVVARLGTTVDRYLLLAIAAAVLVGLLLGAVLGVVVCRLQGVLFAVATLSASAAAESLVNSTQALGGPDGMSVPLPDVIGTGPLGATAVYLFTCVVLAAVLVVYMRVRHTRIGRAIESLRDAPVMAGTCGVDAQRLRLRVFVISAMLGALGGALFALGVGYVSSSELGIQASVRMLGMDIIGGFGSGWGAVPGAGLMRGLPQALQNLGALQQVAIGLVIVAVLVLLRRGIAGPVDDAIRWLAGRVAGGTAPVVAVEEPRVSPAERLERREAGAPLGVEGLSVRFGGVAALVDVTLEFPPGQVTAIIGPNGSGKTTLLNLVSGTIVPSAGRVRLGDWDLTTEPVYRRAAHGITRTFQIPQLATSLTVLENVMVGQYRKRLRSADAAAEANQLLGALGLAHLRDANPQHLAPGQQRLLEVARCLAAAGQVVLLDEPAAGLSDDERTGLAEVIRGLRDAGHTVVLIEHDVAFVTDLADTIVALNRGEVLTRGAPTAVMADPRVVEVYSGSVSDTTAASE